ncbi:MAG: tripartite tricarboxylate transporter substrate binding protein [Burkholderiales bacterium]|nr:tripartite tricarboxylate transporter substrate binding protein [Burkholderiales bacterium]
MLKSHPFACLTALCAALFITLSVNMPATAAGQYQYPQRPVRLVIPYPPGGAGDIVGRLLGNSLGAAMGQQFVSDNRGGGGQIIATQISANAAPDGYTLFLASATHSINPALRNNLPYDTLKAFAPITLVAESPLVFVVHPSLKAANIRELIALAKTQPGRLNYASSGPGTGGHMSVELLKSLTGIDLVHIPYKGAGPALVDVVAGQVQIICTSPLPAMPHVKAGRLRALGMTSLQRSPAHPDVPPVADTVPGYQSTLWYALLAPASTPQAIVKKVHAETVKALAAPQMREQLLALGATPVGNSPQELQNFMRDEIAMWNKLVKQANIKLNP